MAQLALHPSGFGSYLISRDDRTQGIYPSVQSAYDWCMSDFINLGDELLIYNPNGTLFKRYKLALLQAEQ